MLKISKKFKIGTVSILITILMLTIGFLHLSNSPITFKNKNELSDRIIVNNIADKIEIHSSVWLDEESYLSTWNITSHDVGRIFATHTADMNDDGIDDLLVSNWEARTVEIWTFNSSNEWDLIDTIGPYAGDTHGITTGDYDEDGDIDVVVGLRYNGFYLSINDSGSWRAPIMLEGGYGWEVETADLNNDTHLDILATGDTQIFCLYGDGTGNFMKQNIYGLPRGSSVVDPGMPMGGHLSIADLDNDGDLDIAGFIRQGGWNYYDDDQMDSFIRGFINKGTYSNGNVIWGVNASDVLGFQTGIRYSSSSESWENLIPTTSREGGIADYNKDGYMDLIAVNNSDNTLRLLRGFDDDGVLNWTSETINNSLYAGFYYSTCAQFSDINSDGNVDIIQGSYELGNDLLIYYGDGKGNFTTETITTGCGLALDGLRSCTADFNNDGMIDIATTRYSGEGDDGFTVLMQNSTFDYEITEITEPSNLSSNNVPGFPFEIISIISLFSIFSIIYIKKRDLH
ncbi:MAG: FG-GAP repeat domain-containing protein [Promethearchaeota archaeon]